MLSMKAEDIKVILIKVILLASFLLLLFVEARVHDLITWCQRSQWNSESLPSSLSVNTLKELLEQRGIPYGGVVEKSELVQLVKASGAVTAMDVESLQGPDEGITEEDTRFTSGFHFHQDVEQSREGAWLVMVIVNDDDDHSENSTASPLAEKAWQSLRQRVGRLGVRIGVMECIDDRAWCKKRRWNSSRLKLYVPQVNSIKPLTLTYSGSLDQPSVYRWLLQRLHLNVARIAQPRLLRKNWLTFRGPLQQPEMHAVLFTNKTKPPPFFSALSAQFPDFVKFAWVETSSTDLADWTGVLDIKPELTLPFVAVANSEAVYVYGQVQAECMTYGCMQTFFSHVRPSQDSALNVSFIVASLLALLDVFLYKRRLAMRVLKGCVVYYVVTVVLWLVLSAEDTPVGRSVNALVTKITRFLAMTSFGAVVRRDVILFSRSLSLFLICLPLAILVMKVLALQLTGGELDETEDEAEADEDDRREEPNAAEE